VRRVSLDPIVVQADRPRKARVFGNTSPLEVRFCAFIARKRHGWNA
jgi:hypothetical protein